MDIDHNAGLARAGATPVTCKPLVSTCSRVAPVLSHRNKDSKKWRFHDHRRRDPLESCHPWTTYSRKPRLVSDVFSTPPPFRGGSFYHNTHDQLHFFRRRNLKQAPTAVTAGGGGGDKAGASDVDPSKPSKPLFWEHTAALLKKRLLTFRRDKKMWAFVVLMPAFFVLVGTLILLAVTRTNEPSLLLSPTVRPLSLAISFFRRVSLPALSDPSVVPLCVLSTVLYLSVSSLLWGCVGLTRHQGRQQAHQRNDVESL